MDKREFILDLANRLILGGNTMPGSQLAIVLNNNGYRTTYGSEYVGARGTYTLIESIYNWFMALGRDDDAQTVAEAFPTPDGRYAYEK